MRSVCRIRVDVHEGRSGVIAALRRRGVDVAVDALSVGDYELAPGTILERKTVVDLHVTLERGRFWSQIGRLREAAQRPYLLIEGIDVRLGRVGDEAIRAVCMTVLGLGVPILRSVDPDDSAAWMCQLALRARGRPLHRDRPAYARRRKPVADRVPEAMLVTVPGISVVAARALLTRFSTIANLARADEASWLEVPGIGEARAAALRRALRSERL